MPDTKSDMSIDPELYKAVIDFRNTIQQERDRLYKTSEVSVEGIRLAQDKFFSFLKAREDRLITEARLEELETIGNEGWSDEDSILAEYLDNRLAHLRKDRT